MTVPSALKQIRTKFRRMTAAQTDEQIPDEEIDLYINTFYIQDFPEHNRMESLKSNISFYTKANIDAYRLGNALTPPGERICPYTQDQIISVEPPMYVSGYQVYFTQSPEQFWRLNPEITTMEQDAFGDGISTLYTGQTSAFPMLRGYSDNGDVLTPRVLVTALSTAGVTMNIVDSPPTSGAAIGVFVDPITKAVAAGSSINYLTGAFTAVFPTAVAANAPITIEYVPIQLSRPVMALFYQGIFFLRPTPDQGYYVEIQSYRTPTIVLAGETQPPELSEWWQTIACGAALKFFEDNGDFDSYAKYAQLMTQYRRLAARRNIAQISRDRAPTIYSNQEGANVGAQFPYYQY